MVDINIIELIGFGAILYGIVYLINRFHFIIMIIVFAVILLFFGYITASQEQNIIIMNKNRNFLGFCVIEGVRFTGNVDCERFDNISVGDSCIFEKHVDFYLYKLVSCKKIKEV